MEKMILMEVKTIWWYKVQGGSHERMERKCIAVDETQVNFLSDFSWTYQRHWNELVALTLKNVWYGGPMVIWPMNRITQPDSIMVMEWKCHVQEQPTTNEVIEVFFLFSPIIANRYLFIFIKLEEDNICLFYNLPFGQAHRYVLTSLAIGKLVLV